MNNKKKLRFSIFFLLLVIPLYAADSNFFLSLEDAINFALEKNLTFKATKNTLRSSELNLLSSQSSLYPSAIASISGSENIQSSSTFSSVNSSLSGKTSLGINYDLSISKLQSYSAEKRSYEATLYEIRMLKKEIVTEIIKKYIQIVGSQKIIDVEKQNVDYQKHKLEEIETLVSYGRKSRTDLFQQRANLSSAKYRLLNAELDYRQKILSFTSELLISPDVNYQLDTSIISKFISFFKSEEGISFVNDSLPETDNIRSKKSKIVATQIWLDAAKCNYFPSLSFYSGLSIDKRFNGSNLNYEINDAALGFSAGLSIDIPIFDRKQRWLQVQKAKNSLENSKLELEKEFQALALNIRKTFLTDTLIGEKILTAIANYEAAKEALEAMDERYKNGAATLTELIASQTAFLDASLLLLNTQIERIICRLDILYYLDRIEKIPFLPQNFTEKNPR